MKSFGKDYAWPELVKTALAHNEKLQNAIATHLCTSIGVVPTENSLGPYLVNSPFVSNQKAIKTWLTDYLLKNDQLPSEVDLQECVGEFRSTLYQRVPNHLLGGLD